jgi:hypothetical protein
MLSWPSSAIRNAELAAMIAASLLEHQALACGGYSVTATRQALLAGDLLLTTRELAKLAKQRARNAAWECFVLFFFVDLICFNQMAICISDSVL